MVLAAHIQRWKSPTLQMNGRPGQKQDGVDIYGPDDLGRKIGIQCKRYKDGIDMKVVNAEVASAEKYIGVFSALYIATMADHDAKLQQEVRVLSESGERSIRGRPYLGPHHARR